MTDVLIAWSLGCALWVASSRRWLPGPAAYLLAVVGMGLCAAALAAGWLS